MHRINSRTVLAFIIIVFLVIILWAFATGLDVFSSSAETEQLHAVEQMIERAIIQCYALEGGFPPDLEYLKSYGVVLNYDRFVYDYNVIGVNVMPTITVTAKD